MAAAADVLGLDPESVSIDFSAWGPLMAQAATRFEELETGGVQSTGMAGRGQRGGVGGAPGGEWARGDGGDQGAADGEPAGVNGDEPAGTNAMAGIADLRAKIRSGEITEDSARALFSRIQQRRGGARQPGAAAEGETSAASGEAGGDTSGASSDADGRAEGDARSGQRAGRRDGAGGAERSGGGFRGGMMAAMGGSAGDRAYRPAVVFVVNEAGDMTPRPVVMGLSDWDYVEILAGLEAGEKLALIGAAQLQARQQERLQRMRQRMRPF